MVTTLEDAQRAAMDCECEVEVRYTVHPHGVPADATQTSDHYPPQVLTQHNLPNGRIILAQTRAIAEAISKDMDAHMVERKQR